MNNNFEEIRNKKLSEMTGNELNQLIVESIRESKNDKINDVSQAMKILLVTIYYLFFAVFFIIVSGSIMSACNEYSKNSYIDNDKIIAIVGYAAISGLFLIAGYTVSKSQSNEKVKDFFNMNISIISVIIALIALFIAKK